MANENNRITIRTSSAPSGVTVSSIDTRQALEVTNNDARYYSDLAKKYKDEARALRDDAKYYAEQNSDVTMLYVNNLEARLQGQIDSKQAVGDYALNSAIPTNVSSLNNDSNYVNLTQMNSAIDSVRLPAQTNHEGEFLSTDGEAPLWKDISELKMFDLISNDHILSYEEMKGYVPLGEYVYKEALAGSYYGYPDFYEKCLAEYNNPNNELEIIKNNYTVAGSPIISSNGIASGLSSTNRVYISSISFSQTDKIIVNFGFFYKIDSEVKNLWVANVSNSANVFRLVINSVGDLVMFHPSAGIRLNRLSGGFYPQEGDFVQVKTTIDLTKSTDNISFTATTNGVTYSSNIGTYTGNVTDVSNISMTATSNTFNGSIDLKQFSITVDGVEVFSGNRTGIDTIKPDNYTIVGSPTISADGVASGFSTSNYLKGYVFSPENSAWKIKFAFKTASTVSTSYLYSSMNKVDGVNILLSSSMKLILHLSNNDTSYNIADIQSDNALQANTQYFVIAEFDGVNTYKLSYSTDGINYITKQHTNSLIIPTNESTDGRIGCSTHFGASFDGSIDLNSFKIYVNGNLVYQPCLKIPYTESNTGVKVVDTAYRVRVEDMYEQYGYNPYCMSDEYHEIVTYNAVDCIRTNPNGHKFYDISNKPEIDDIYDNTGSAWFYGVDINRERILLPRREDTNNLQNTYMVVGNTTSWTGMTSVVNQGMTLLEQVNKGMSNVALSRLDLDVSNISSDGKNRVIDWLMPDYNLGIKFTSVPYTAPSNGICYVSTGAANTTAVITLNGITVGKVGYHDGNEGSISILVNKGDVISGTGNYGTPNGYFFPFKGA